MSTVRAFMFHDVRNLADTKFPKRYELRSFLNKTEFTHQIDVIRNRYKVINSREVRYLDLKEGNTDYALLTFDDGLADHYFVYEYLNSLDLSGTFLVPTAPVLEHQMIHSHKIQFILAAAQDEKVLAEDILSNFTNRNDLWEEFSATKWKDNWWTKEMIFTTNFLRRYNRNGFDNYHYTNELFLKYVGMDCESFSQDFYLGETQLEEIGANDTMTIGGHGNSSENLLLVGDVETEIQRSQQFVMNYADEFVFSYPNGGFDERVKDTMKRNGCTLSYTVAPVTLTELDVIDYLEFPRYDSPQRMPLK